MLSMLEKIKCQLMTRFYSKDKECAEKWTGNICPKIKKKTEKNDDLVNTCFTLPDGRGVFRVTDKEHQYIVDVTIKQCDCRRWQLTSIPCSHAISYLRLERIHPEEMVSLLYYRYI